jgi:hypothetical protein
MRRISAEIAPKVIAAGGGSPYYSPNLRRLMLEAGFARTEGYAVAAEQYGTLEETRRYASIVARLIQNPDLRQLVLANGWATADEIETMLADVLAWGERPDAFAAVMYCAALGWVDR